MLIITETIHNYEIMGQVSKPAPTYGERCMVVY